MGKGADHKLQHFSVMFQLECLGIRNCLIMPCTLVNNARVHLLAKLLNFSLCDYFVHGEERKGASA